MSRQSRRANRRRGTRRDRNLVSNRSSSPVKPLANKRGFPFHFTRCLDIAYNTMTAVGANSPREWSGTIVCLVPHAVALEHDVGLDRASGGERGCPRCRCRDQRCLEQSLLELGLVLTSAGAASWARWPTSSPPGGPGECLRRWADALLGLRGCNDQHGLSQSSGYRLRWVQASRMVK